MQEGARLVIDGRGVKVAGHERGFFIGPCLFDDVQPGMRIYREEIFGPVLCVVRVPDLDAALRVVNGHEFGNGTAIFTASGEAARSFLAGRAGRHGWNQRADPGADGVSFVRWLETLAFWRAARARPGRRALLYAAQDRYVPLADVAPRECAIRHADDEVIVPFGRAYDARRFARLRLVPGTGRGVPTVPTIDHNTVAMLSRRLQSSTVVRAAGLTIVAAMLTALPGCSTISSMMPKAREAKQTQLEMRQLQAKCMRFADDYVGSVVEETTRFHRAFVDPELRQFIARWTLSQANSAYTIASGDSAVVSALDLVTLTVLSRMVVEDSIVPRFPSESAPLLAMHRQLEEEAWELTDDFMTESQIQDFRDILAKWRARNPSVTSVAFVHFLDFANEIGRPAPGEAARSGNLFGLIGLDPLAGLDPAVRQIEQTRLFAERMIYYLQRVPYVVNLQVDEMTSELMLRPEVRGMLADTDRVSRSMERFAGVAEDLPATIARERQAIIDQFSNVLVAQEATLRPMLLELRQALEAGDGMAGSVDGVVKSIDALLAHWPSPPPGAQESPPGKPFDITEYTQAAVEFTRTANELRQLLTTLDAQAPALSSTIGSTIDHGRSLIDDLALRVAALIAVLIGGTLAAALAYRYLAVRMKA